MNGKERQKKSRAFRLINATKDIMMNVKSRLEKIQHINRNVLLPHDAQRYSETTLELQLDIDTVL
jgi:hypothetical protein